MSERDDDELDDASMKSMRAVWLSMRDEEPPAAGMSGLLAAARDKADSMREQPAWWQRVVTQLRRPPALAFATVMILVGGAVLVTRTSKQVETKVDEPAMQETASGGLRIEAELRNGQGSAQVLVPLEQAPTPEPVPAEVKEAVKDPAKDPVKDPVKIEKPKPRPKSNRPVNDALDDKHEPDRDHRFNTEPKTGFSNADGTGDTGTGTVLETPGRVRETPSAPPINPTTDATNTTKKPPGAKPAEEKPAKPVGGDEVTLSDGGQTKTPPNEQLARQAESAASRNDCAAVRAIVAKLKKQDESFYKSRLGKNPAVTKCL